MADVKTTLRELSVAATLDLFIRGVDFVLEDLYSNDYLINRLHLLHIDDSAINKINEVIPFDDSIKDIIRNGYRLASYIYNCGYFVFNIDDEIVWVGGETQNGNPVDLIVGRYSFSLKEDSYILNNMGLYNFLNYLTGSHFERGLHVFKWFAPEDYDSFFNYTWQRFVSYLRIHNFWVANYNTNSYAEINGDVINMYHGYNMSSIPVDIDSFDSYIENTDSSVREKVFAKWINAYLSNDREYIIRKQTSSAVAGHNLVEYVNDNYSYENLPQFFRFMNKPYYYAKVTENNIEIYKVPVISDLDITIKYVGCSYEVPVSQLNILTTFKNLNTNRTICFRNECRYSHGQFNGTPEAKLYLGRDSSLTDLYEPIV